MLPRDPGGHLALRTDLGGPGLLPGPCRKRLCFEVSLVLLGLNPSNTGEGERGKEGMRASPSVRAHIPPAKCRQQGWRMPVWVWVCCLLSMAALHPSPSMIYCGPTWGGAGCETLLTLWPPAPVPRTAMCPV